MKCDYTTAGFKKEGLNLKNCLGETSGMFPITLVRTTLSGGAVLGEPPPGFESPGPSVFRVPAPDIEAMNGVTFCTLSSETKARYL